MCFGLGNGGNRNRPGKKQTPTGKKLIPFGQKPGFRPDQECALVWAMEETLFGDLSSEVLATLDDVHDNCFWECVETEELKPHVLCCL